jgi:hypothetical protein
VSNKELEQETLLMHKVVVQAKHLSGSTSRSQLVLMKLLVGIHIASAYTLLKGTFRS